MVAKGIVIGGTTSDAGKSLMVAGLCRWLARQGVKVAPFKSQNMSNNSMVVPGGVEIGRAQWLQAAAAQVTPSELMNPVLLKPGSDLCSHIVLAGKPYGAVHSKDWDEVRPVLARAAFDALGALRDQFDVVIAEGAGSPAEINLRARDFTNLGLATHADWPMVVVGDIDRGGVLAAFYGTLAVCDEADQRHIAGWLVNKFRGHLPLLQPGLTQLESLTHRPVLGVVPYLPQMWVDAEDSLSASAAQQSIPGPDSLHIAVVKFPRISNTTDIDALVAEPGVHVVMTSDPAVAAAADVVVLPGSRQTCADLQWLWDSGIANIVIKRALADRPVVGICGGYQMLAEFITDTVESDVGTVRGLALMPTRITFAAEKTLHQPVGEWQGHEVTGYEIHHGQVSVTDGTMNPAVRPFLDGFQAGSVWGTHWHGAWENDDFRRAWLTQVAQLSGSSWKPQPGALGFAQRREEMLDTLADAIAEHTDTSAWWRLIDDGVPVGLPTRAPGFGG